MEDFAGVECPAVADLLDPERPAALQGHIDECLRCRALRGSLTPLDEDARITLTAERFHAEPVAAPPDKFGVGTVVRLWAHGVEEALVAVIADVSMSQADVVPVSDSRQMATDLDVLFDRSLLGYPSMAQTWNAGRVLVEQIADTLAELDEDKFTAFESVYSATLVGDETPSEAPVGPPIISDNDPRLGFQQHEAEFARQFYTLAVDHDVDDLAALVQARLTRCHLDRGSLEERFATTVGSPELLRRLLAGHPDDFTGLEPSVVGDVLWHLGVTPTYRLREILAGCVPLTPQPGSALAPARRAPTVSAGGGRVRRALLSRSRKNASERQSPQATWADAVLRRLDELAADESARR